MRTGKGGIYQGTYGDVWLNGGELRVAAPAKRAPTAEQTAALCAAVGPVLVLDEFGIPGISASLQAADEAVRKWLDNLDADDAELLEELIEVL